MTWYGLFKQGAQIGLLPDQVLDLDLWQFNAVVDGYQESILDQTVIAVQSGYWSCYWNMNPDAKTLQEVIRSYTHPNEIAEEKDVQPDINQFVARTQLFEGSEHSVNTIY